MKIAIIACFFAKWYMNVDTVHQVFVNIKKPAVLCGLIKYLSILPLFLELRNLLIAVTEYQEKPVGIQQI